MVFCGLYPVEGDDFSDLREALDKLRMSGEIENDPVIGNVASVSVGIYDGTPVLDIKPYVPDLFPRNDVRLGWLRGKVERMTGSVTGER